MSFYWINKDETTTRRVPTCDVCNQEINQVGGGSYGPILECGCGEGFWYVKPIHFNSPLPALQNYVDPFYVPWDTPDRLVYDETGSHSLQGSARNE